MKRILTILCVILAFSEIHSQSRDNLSFSATLGYGIDLNTPTCNPVGLEIDALYNFNSHVGLGIGVGVIRYEKTLIPIFLSGQYRFSHIGKFVPYLDGAFGYGINPCKNGNGGFHATPSFGVLYALNSKIQLKFAVGYQYQTLDRLKKFENDLFHAEFKEHLTHNSIGIKVGISF